MMNHLKRTYSYSSGYKYKTQECIRFSLPRFFRQTRVRTRYLTIEYGMLTIAKGYAWNGASGPVPDGPKVMFPSLVHDALYQLMREGVLNPAEYKRQSDILFVDMCKERGVWKWVAEGFGLALDRFGSYAIENKLPTQYMR